MFEWCQVHNQKESKQHIYQSSNAISNQNFKVPRLKKVVPRITDYDSEYLDSVKKGKQNESCRNLASF